MSLKISIWLLFLFCIQPLHSFAKESISAELTAVANSNPLLQYQEQGENKGPSVEILNALLTEANLNANLVFMPWARAFSTAKNVSNTLVLSMIRTPEREADFHWIIKVSQAVRVFISLKNESENYVSTIEQAKNKLIGVVLDTAAHKELKLAGFSEKKNLYIISSEVEMVRLLANNRIDLVYSDPNNIKKNLQIIGKGNIAIRHKEIVLKNQRESYIALNINTDEKIVNQLKQAAEKFIQTEEYSYLVAK